MGHIAHLKYFYEYETCILQIVALKEHMCIGPGFTVLTIPNNHYLGCLQSNIINCSIVDLEKNFLKHFPLYFYVDL